MKNLLITIGAAVAMIFASCGGESPFPGYDAAENGTYFKLHTKGAGTTSVDTGGAVFLKLKFKTEKDSVFLDVNYGSNKPSYPMRVEKAAFKGDFMDMFLRLHAGDSATFFISLDSLKKYYKEEFVFEPKYDSMKYLGFALKVDSVFTRAQVEVIRTKAETEQKAQQELAMKMQAVMMPIQQKAKEVEPMLKKKDATLLKPYLAANKITAKPDENGVYYQEILPGTGNPFVPGTIVSVRYVGKYLDGTLFDTNTLIEGQPPMTFQIGDGRLIPGFTNSVAKMKKGGKSTFILPPKMGYNDSLTRVFDVEVVDVREGGGQMMPGQGQ